METNMNALFNELTQGMNLAKQLRFHLAADVTSAESKKNLLQRILDSYNNALRILNCTGSPEQFPGVQPISNAVETTTSFDGSLQSELYDRGVKEPQQNQNGSSKKRKSMPRWTDQVKITPENGLEGPNEDGYSWRKYGQKDILGCKFPRSYYRCTYRSVKDCWATKQVQRSDEDLTVFDVTYRGKHTCVKGSHSNQQPATPETTEANQNQHENNHNQNQILVSLRNGLRVDTDNLDSNNESYIFSPSMFMNDNLLNVFSESFISPDTSGSTYFSMSSNFGEAQMMQHTEYDFTDIVSANTSATSSPFPEFDFSKDTLDFDPNYPFGNPDFFSIE